MLIILFFATPIFSDVSPYFIQIMCFKTRGLYKCGKCPECLAERQNSWALRLIEYSKTHSCFSCLLTYNNESVPLTKEGQMSLCKRDIQLFIKRLRHVFPQNKIKYYIAGEYSPEKFRPHYHCLIFNLPKENSKSKTIALLEEAWQNGFVGSHSNWLKSNAQINYALGYFIYLYDWQDSDQRCKPFSLISKGLAMDWHGDKFNKILDEAFKYVRLFGYDDIVEDGKIYQVPRWNVRLGSPAYLELCKREVIEPFYFDFEEQCIKVIPELEDVIKYNSIIVPQTKFDRSKNETKDCKPKSFKIPRPWRERVIPKDIQRVINILNQLESFKREKEYLEKYGEYDKTTDFPMWKQLKYYRYCQKKKNKKSKLLSDPLTYFE